MDSPSPAGPHVALSDLALPIPHFQSSPQPPQPSYFDTPHYEHQHFHDDSGIGLTMSEPFRSFAQENNPFTESPETYERELEPELEFEPEFVQGSSSFPAEKPILHRSSSKYKAASTDLCQHLQTAAQACVQMTVTLSLKTLKPTKSFLQVTDHIEICDRLVASFMRLYHWVTSLDELIGKAPNYGALDSFHTRHVNRLEGCLRHLHLFCEKLESYARGTRSLQNFLLKYLRVFESWTDKLKRSHENLTAHVQRQRISNQLRSQVARAFKNQQVQPDP